MSDRLNNIHIIIQARMNADRMPGKVLKDLSGFPMLYHVVERCRLAQKADNVIVATTLSSADDEIADFCKKNGIDYFRGSEQNVLERYYQCAKHFGSRIIVRICADNPLIDPVIIDACIEALNDQANLDYVITSPAGKFPLGITVEAFSFAALEKAYQQAKKPYEQEHVTPYIRENKKQEFHVKSLTAPAEYARNHRLTVDYPEDFQLMEVIYKNFYQPESIIKVPAVLEFLDQHPEVSSINAHCRQKPVTTI